jgi:outer membrane biosynthesis protein TonB
MKKTKKKSVNKTVWITSATVALVFICAGGFLIKTLMTDNGHRDIKKQVQMMRLVSPPPPPPKVEEKPIPEVKPKETLKEDKFEAPRLDAPPQANSNDKPQGKDLGLDAEGGPGSDSFGLKGIPGGQTIIGGGGSGGGSPMGQYAWYARIIQDEIRDAVQKHLSQNGGIPKGKLETVLKIVLDDKGSIVRFEIMNSSGDHKLDDALKSTVKGMMISQRPPDGMPRALSLKVSTQG